MSAAQGDAGPSGAPRRAAGHGAGRTALAVVCGVILTMMMALTVLDVIGRYGFNSPLIGATELTEVLLISVVFIGLPAVSIDRAHVTVDLLVTRIPDRIQPVRRIAVGVVCVGVQLLVAWRLWLQGNQIDGYGGVTNSLRLPVAPVAWFCALCTLAAAAVTLWQIGRDIAAPARPKR